MKRLVLLVTAALTLAVAPRQMPPRPSHVIVIVEENKSYRDIIGNIEDAPYINSLPRHAALLTNSHAVAHPSQPNYMALFSGLQNSDGDSCAIDGVSPDARNLGGEALKAGLTFVGYAEDLPGAGSDVCYAGQYARKHVPWVHFRDIPAADSQPFANFPSFDRLPTIAFVIPNELNDMHSASIERGDAWLAQHIDPLIAWAMKHNTLVVLTWDEDDGSNVNHIATLLLGPMVRPGRYDALATHYTILRTIEDMYRLAPAGASATAVPLSGIFR